MALINAVSYQNSDCCATHICEQNRILIQLENVGECTFNHQSVLG